MSLKTMVVDDELQSMKLMRSLAAPLDHMVVTFEDRQEAGQRAEKQRFDVAFLGMRLPQLDGSIDLLAVIQFDGRVDRSATVASLPGPPLSVCIEVLQRETDRVHDLVATRTLRILPVERHLVTQRQGLSGPAGRILQRRNVGRGLRRGSAEDVFKDPDASLDR